MSELLDRFNQFIGKTRFIVCRIFVHLKGEEIAPLLDILNQTAKDAIEAEGDLNVIGEGLVNLCQSLLEHSTFWHSAANEGNVFWNEGNAGDYVTELFTDSQTRYLSSSKKGLEFSQNAQTSPVTRNLVVIIAVACEGKKVPELEIDLAKIDALETGLKALINLHYQSRLRAIQVHYSPAHLNDELTNKEVSLNFPELVNLLHFRNQKN